MTDSTVQFRIANQRLLLTYKTHIPKEALLAFVESFKPVARAMISHETGGEGGYEHTHMAVEFTKVVQSRNARVLDYELIHPNIKVLPNKKAFLDACKYLGKEDQEPLKTGEFYDSLVEAIQGCSDKSEAIGRFGGGGQSEIQYAMQVMAIYDLKQEAYEMSLDLKEWQQELKDILDGPVDKRAIYWYYDEVGGAGKTEFTKWMVANGGRDVLFLNNLGGIKDCATNVVNARKSGWTGKILLCDLPRACEAKAIYEPLEACKNGMVTAVKYQGGNALWKTGHVVVFANFLPNTRAMSRDRWRIYVLKEGRASPLTLNTVEKLVAVGADM